MPRAQGRARAAVAEEVPDGLSRHSVSIMHARSPADAAPMLLKIIVIAVLVLIFASLFSALVFLIRDRGQGKRVATALTWRIGLSISLFLLLLAGFYFGIIPPGRLLAQ